MHEPGSADPQPPAEKPSDRLDSWKDIAWYLKRDVSTVQRWEKREGMPVHRHLHDKLGTVYAFPRELDAWSRRRSLQAEAGPAAAIDLPAAPESKWSRPRRAALLWLTLGALVVISAAVLWVLRSRDSSSKNPLAEARFQFVTDFGGSEQAAAISRDGKFIAFQSDRDGPVDVWVSQLGTGQFHNLTNGTLLEMTNPSVRTVSFSPDGTFLSLWVRRPDSGSSGNIGQWMVPTLGGQVRPYFNDVAEFDWSRDGARLVYHTPGPGDPLFVRDADQLAGRQIFQAAPGLHGHFPVWSPDGAFIYFVQGTVPDRMDVWRIKPAGGSPERITSHDSYVSHPVFIDERTLLYLAAPGGSSKPGLYALDVDRRVPFRISVGIEQYSSLSATLDGQRLVATITRPKGTIWRVPISDRVEDGSAVRHLELPTGNGVSPRAGRNYFLYVASRGGGDGIWRVENGSGAEVWGGHDAHVIGAPAIAPNGLSVVFAVEEGGRKRLYAMEADGTNARVLTESLELRGSPAWSPDGESITIAANQEGMPRLVRVSLDGRSIPLTSEYSIDPVWSPDGRFVAYSGPDVGTSFPVKALSADAQPYPIASLVLPRGARRLVFRPGMRELVALRRGVESKDFWLIDLETGHERQLTNLGQDFTITDFDVSPDGREIIFDRLQENSDIVLIERRSR